MTEVEAKLANELRAAHAAEKEADAAYSAADQAAREATFEAARAWSARETARVLRRCAEDSLLAAIAGVSTALLTAAAE